MNGLALDVETSQYNLDLVFGIAIRLIVSPVFISNIDLSSGSVSCARASAWKSS